MIMPAVRVFPPNQLTKRTVAHKWTIPSARGEIDIRVYTCENWAASVKLEYWRLEEWLFSCRQIASALPKYLVRIPQRRNQVLVRRPPPDTQALDLKN